MEHLLGYEVIDSSLDDCVEQILEHVAARRRSGTLACLNPHSYAVARGDTAFAAALRQATWLVPDGAGVVLASRLLGGGIRQRIAGPDVFMRLHERLDAIGGVRVFFLGASEDTLSRIRARMALEHPRIVVAGALSPPVREQFSDDENAAMVGAVNCAAPDVLWVAMTAPKQEKWLHAHREFITAPFAGAVGAVFDFYVGKVQRSSPWFRRLGLEWLPRLLREPRRLWRRTFVSAPVFLLDVLSECWRSARR